MFILDTCIPCHLGLVLGNLFYGGCGLGSKCGMMAQVRFPRKIAVKIQECKGKGRCGFKKKKTPML